jgi:NADH dehydrogenase
LASRHPERALERWGRRPGLDAVAADVRDDASVAAAVAGADAVVNAVSLYVERDGDTFQGIHVDAAGRVARRCGQAGVRRLIQFSGIGADPGSPSRYIRARGEGEEAVRANFEAAVIVRPAVMTGPADGFLSTFIDLLRRWPVFPLFGRGRTRLEPVYVEDVATAVARAVQADAPAPLYEFGGAEVFTYRELLAALTARLGVRRALVPVPFALWTAAARAAERLPRPPITVNQVELAGLENVASGRYPGLRALGVEPTLLAEVVERILDTG